MLHVFAAIPLILSQPYWWAAFLLLIEEAGIPIPIGDLLVTYTGYQVFKGSLSFLSAFLLLLIADLIGASFLFFLCSRYGQLLINKTNKFLEIDQKKLDWLDRQFRRFGPLLIIFGRHLPGLRVPITVFAGLSGIRYRVFILSTLLSVGVWIPIYLVIGQRLGPQAVHLFHADARLFLIGTLPIILLLVAVYFLRKKPHRR